MAAIGLRRRTVSALDEDSIGTCLLAVGEDNGDFGDAGGGTCGHINGNGGQSGSMGHRTWI